MICPPPAMSSNAGIIGVSVGPGLMQLRRMPFALRSIAAFIVQMISASFDCEYAPEDVLGVPLASTPSPTAKFGRVDERHPLLEVEEVAAARGRRDAADRTAVGHVWHDAAR